MQKAIPFISTFTNQCGFFCVCADKKVKINFNRFCSSQNRYEEIEIKKSFLMPGRLVYGVFSEELRTRVKKCTGSSGCMTCKSSPRFNPFHGLQESCFCDRRDRMETNFGISWNILNAKYIASDFDVSFNSGESP